MDPTRSVLRVGGRGGVPLELGNRGPQKGRAPLQLRFRSSACAMRLVKDLARETLVPIRAS